MLRPVIIIGAGGHARVLIAALILLRREIIGVTEARFENSGVFISGVPIIGNDEKILRYNPEDVEIVNGIGSIGLPIKRMKIFQQFKSLGYSFSTIVHPTALIEKDVKLDEGVQIMAGAILQTGSMIADNSIINTGTIVGHDCIIGEHVHLAPGVVLSGGVQIGAMTHIGTAATIMQSVKIGGGTVIGAGAVVIRNISKDVIAAGVPARIIKKR